MNLKFDEGENQFQAVHGREIKQDFNTANETDWKNLKLSTDYYCDGAAGICKDLLETKALVMSIENYRRRTEIFEASTLGHRHKYLKIKSAVLTP